MFTFNEAEASLEQCDKIADKRSRIASVPEEEIDDWNIKIYTAVAKYKYLYSLFHQIIYLFVYKFRLAAKQKKHAKALTYFEKVLNIIEETSGRESSDLIGGNICVYNAYSLYYKNTAY